MAEELTCAGGDVNNASSTSMPCLNLLEGEGHFVKLAIEANVMSALDRLSLLPLTGGHFVIQKQAFCLDQALCQEMLDSLSSLAVG